MKLRASQENIVLVIAAVLFVVFSVVLNGFLSPGNLLSLVQNVSILGILGVGMALAVIGRGIDLSMVATMAMSVAWMLDMANAGTPPGLALSMALLFVVAVGLINGILIAYVEIPAIFATLAMGILVYGFGKAFLVGTDVVYLPQTGHWLWQIGSGRSLGIPNVVIAFALVAALAADWDATKAHGITATILKQHPDLCGILGLWDGQDIGAAAAIREAGMQDQVFLVSSGGGSRAAACDNISNGNFDACYSYDVPGQARDLIAVVTTFGLNMPSFLSGANLSDVGRIYGEYVFIVIGMTFVMMAGGIDLSVGSVFALCNFVALALINYLQWPLAFGIPVVMLVGASVGLINGVLIGYLGLRAFLTTLVMLIIVRAVVDQLLLDHAMTISRGFNPGAAWEFMAIGDILGLPASLAVAVLVALAGHLVLTRMRFGWHVMAVGGSRRSAFNAGIRVKRTVCLTYVLSGLLTGLAACFYAARLTSASADVGRGMEVTVLTAVVLGGISLGGGRGSVVKALLGAIIVILLQNGLIRMGLMSGTSSLIMGGILLLAVAIDVRWMKNRHKVLARAYVSPTYFRLPPLPETAAGSGSVYALNDKLREVEAIGLGQLDGPEDVIFDRDDNLYCGSRHGDVIRILAPDYRRHEVFAHIGGHPLGMAFDAAGDLHVCVGGMGLFKISPAREVTKLSDETNRSWLSVIDDSRLRLADDLDIAPDGRVFFSEATVRYEMYDWMVDALEARGNGRIICYDPRDGSSRTVLPNLQLPNGICVEHGGQSLLYAETWGCRITRYFFDGPRKGQREVVIANLPGYPDNINRASDGTYWCALCGMRSPVFDLAQRMPAFRRRMVQRVARDNGSIPT